LRPGLQPSLSQPEVTVTLRGTRQQLDQISSTNILALANLASFTGPGTKPVTIDVQLPTDSPVKAIKVDPPTVQVTVTALATPTPIPTATVPPPTPTPIPTLRPPTSTAAP
jgi:hypothetical protein